MDLEASKIVKAAIGGGYVPVSLACAGQTDQPTRAIKTVMTTNKAAEPGHTRMLVCHFEPPEKYGPNPVGKCLDEVRVPNAKIAASGARKIGALEVQHMEMQLRSQGGVALSIHACALLHLGIVHRYTLSILQEKSAEGLKSLEKLIAEACGPS